MQCCNTCDDVREAYGRKGWAFHISPQIKQVSAKFVLVPDLFFFLYIYIYFSGSFLLQCTKDGILDRINEQKGEGCRMTGHIVVNKVNSLSTCMAFPPRTVFSVDFRWLVIFTSRQGTHFNSRTHICMTCYRKKLWRSIWHTTFTIWLSERELLARTIRSMTQRKSLQVYFSSCWLCPRW